MTNYQALANAIVNQAAKDYFCASYEGNRGIKRECLKFFHSTWFKVLTNLKPNYLIERLDQELETMCKAEEKLKAANIKYKILFESFSIMTCRDKEVYTWNSCQNIDEFIKEITE